MPDISEAKKLLDEINKAVASYDPVLKERARDILLKEAFGAETRSSKTNDTAKSNAANPETENQPEFHQLVEKWTPTTQAEWVLLSGYYHQVVLGNKNLTAFQVNKELKQHGTTISNITVSFDENINQKPALMRQIEKAGKSKQAKKKYVVTTNGINFVKEKLNAQNQS